MLKIDLDSEAGGVTVRWKVGQGISLHRRDGTLILKINANYADERAVMTAAHALNFMFKSHRHGFNALSPSLSPTDKTDNAGDGREA